MRDRLAVAALTTICLLSISFTCRQTKKAVAHLTVEEARELVKAAVPPEMASLPGLSLDYYSNPACPEFYFFAVLWSNPNPIGSNLSAHIAVNSRTGDVWDPFLTKRFESPKLKKLQELIRKRLGLSDAEYRKLREKQPC